MHEDVVIKPRNDFTDGALRLVTPKIDLRKKKESLSMSLINIGGAGRASSGMFKMSGRVAQEEGRHASFNIARAVSFQSPVGKNGMMQAFKHSSHEIKKVVDI